MDITLWCLMISFFLREGVDAKEIKKDREGDPEK